MHEPDAPEPWLRGTLTEVDAVRRQVLHALELTREDAARWCAGLPTDAMHARPHGLPPVAFHLRHIVRSLDRLLTYAEGRQLTAAQTEALGSEMFAGQPAEEVLDEFHAGLQAAVARVFEMRPQDFDAPRAVGRRRLPTTLGGLLVHCAEHTQRHTGQMITTAKVLLSSRA